MPAAATSAASVKVGARPEDNRVHFPGRPRDLFLLADIERQLQQSIKDADYIHQQISKKEQRIAELMEELQEKGNQTDSLVDQVERMWK